MTCPNCGNSQTEHIRELWDGFRQTMLHIESLIEVKGTLRTFFSPGDDEWTETDDRIGNAMCDLDAVIFSLVEVAGQKKVPQRIMTVIL